MNLAHFRADFPSSSRKYQKMGPAVKLLAFIVLSAGIGTWTVPSHGFLTLKCPLENHGVCGQDSVIQCTLKSSHQHVRVMGLVWRKLGSSFPLISYMGGRLRQTGRFQLLERGWDERNANVSLAVRDTRVADQGLYQCAVLTEYGNAKLIASLRVTAKYRELRVTSIPESNIQEDSTVLMLCTAHGGYPEGTMKWFDQYGTDWTRSAEMQAMEVEEGFFNLTSRFSVWRASSVSPRYRCVLFNGSGAEEDKVEIHLKFSIPEKISRRLSNKSITAVIVVLGSLTSGLLVLTLFQKSECRGPVQVYPRVEDTREVEGLDSLEDVNTAS
ncbi:CD276 antigen-like isoform X2 [Scleropages formosus]|uniref:CD276 antigen-like isoform X2 n=1 Tax=Scleropages formosus TaxID=113540 RepID=UPI0010FAC283|nr:CD276 antigen-like isoform X2 [Scleropages formosus]